MKILLIIIAVLLQACTMSFWTSKTEPEQKPIEQKIKTNEDYYKEEIKKGWQDSYETFIAQNITDKMINVSDKRMLPLCPKWGNLNLEQKKIVWAKLLKSITKFESSFNPLSMYHETTMGPDEITGQIMISEGLLQMSYQDASWTKGCPFDYKSDKTAFLDDLKKKTGQSWESVHPERSTINPYKNLMCGIMTIDMRLGFTNDINAKQDIIKLLGGEYRDGSYKGGYWAVLRDEKFTKYGALSKVMSEFKNNVTFCE